MVPDLGGHLDGNLQGNVSTIGDLKGRGWGWGEVSLVKRMRQVVLRGVVPDQGCHWNW